ncbi:FliI/YscN family ATPase [Sandaracinobacter neustonicus]|uniref:Flagellum-specific ATP synthase n=1 Tax=Sandaracinobacter neustonicus TaxID=1715348 RepID=A0A501XHX6_9SPHN|nr:FliI/YscN family ATPase [Sandaracinobacter neustonicus]TPE60146.1 FliI/YscN family ATPase [Sandaracinobacter neustonicus]
MNAHTPGLAAALRAAQASLAEVPCPLHAAQPGGRIRAAEGLLLSSDGPEAPVGALLSADTPTGPVPCEAIGFRQGRLLMMALAEAAVAPGSAVWLDGPAGDAPAGPALLGRVTGALGEALDSLGPLGAETRWPLTGKPLPPLDRADVSLPLATGVRAIDALLTLGRGQRVGLMAGSGVGKSTLLQQLVLGAEADCVVVGLIGERGREISGFLDALSPEARARTHIVAVPADAAAPARLRGCLAAFASAEALRATGRHVLLLVDSLTRVAHAQREIGLAIGEPAGARGYPPSALALIPRLVERAGNDARSGGAITLLATVLADGDDTVADPVVDTARGVLDGHIILNRSIAARGRFPAIDLGHSLSRTMPACVGAAQIAAATAFRRDLSLAEANQDLVAMGAYSPGHDLVLDRALARRAEMDSFLAQPRDRAVAFADSVSTLVAGWSN